MVASVGILRGPCCSHCFLFIWTVKAQCPEAADLWDSHINGDLSPGEVAMQLHKVVNSFRGQRF